MEPEADTMVQDWAQPGEPFRLVAIAVAGTDWAGRLATEARRQAEKYPAGLLRARAAASEWLKTCWLPRELGRDRLEWSTGEHGKPRLAGPAAEWDFNLSHAGAFAVAALVRGAQVGVDLESLSRRADVELLGRRVFSESERALVRAGGGPAFFDLWSRKEALLKALGCGWADGRIVRQTRIGLAAVQTEPVTGVRIWSRRVQAGAYALAVAVN